MNACATVNDKVKIEIIEPTADERRNGWTATTLSAYLAGADSRRGAILDVTSPARAAGRRPNEQNHKYHPNRWHR